MGENIAQTAVEALERDLIDFLTVGRSAYAQSRDGLKSILADIADQGAVVEDLAVQGLTESIVAEVGALVDPVSIDAALTERPGL